MKNENIMIFGDSYSTFAGCIPAGYAPYYSGRRERGPDIESADQSWWGLMVKETESNLVRNDSWSGSTIGYTGYNNSDTSKTSSFIYRLEKLTQEGFFADNKIDTVFVFGGTNDSWSNAPLGNEMSEGWERKDLYNVLPAISYFFTKLREVLPNAKIYGICNCDIKSEVVNATKNVCDKVGGKAIVLENIDKMNGHPTPLGMVQIKDQVLKGIEE
jgi:hypothetical protein